MGLVRQSRFNLLNKRLYWGDTWKMLRDAGVVIKLGCKSPAARKHADKIPVRKEDRGATKTRLTEPTAQNPA